jgi:hypothetical protein
MFVLEIASTFWYCQYLLYFGTVNMFYNMVLSVPCTFWPCQYVLQCGTVSAVYILVLSICSTMWYSQYLLHFGTVSTSPYFSTVNTVDTLVLSIISTFWYCQYLPRVGTVCCQYHTNFGTASASHMLVLSIPSALWYCQQRLSRCYPPGGWVSVCPLRPSTQTATYYIHCTCCPHRAMYVRIRSSYSANRIFWLLRWLAVLQLRSVWRGRAVVSLGAFRTSGTTGAATQRHRSLRMYRCEHLQRQQSASA